MENTKLQELTQKLYDDGLQRGRNDAEQMIAEAEKQARTIVAEAERKAAETKAAAEREAAELKKNTDTELALAARGVVAALKQSIATMIEAQCVAPSVAAATIDPAFVKEMLLTVARNWNGATEGEISLSALLPESMQKSFEQLGADAAKALLAAGVEVGYSKSVRNGFKIGAKGGRYYISFTDADFDALLGEFLKERIAKMLYTAE